MDFRRRRPSPESLNWVELVAGARVVAWRRLTGGVIAAVHRLTVERDGHRQLLVLRQIERATDRHVELVRREAATLKVVRSRGLFAPELVAVSADGAQTDGHPSILMTRLPGHVHLVPHDRAGWLRQIARAAAEIHSTPVSTPDLDAWFGQPEPAVPASASRPQLWQAMISALAQGNDATERCFIHRDFQHFNFLWRRGRLTGIVDWAMASAGSSGVDVGHCSLNLAILFGVEVAERFRLAYEAEAGRVVDPWWELHAVARYSDGWQHVIPVQVDGRAPLDIQGMTGRVEDLMASILRRL